MKVWKTWSFAFFIKKKKSVRVTYCALLLTQGLLEQSVLLGAGNHSSLFCLIVCHAQRAKSLSESSDKEAK